MVIAARYSPRFYLLRQSAPRGIYLKKIHFNFVNPHAAILKTPVWGLPASTVRRCVALLNHINAGAPYSAIHVNILLKFMILCVGVPGFLWLRFNTYNNQRMLYKSSQIFCSYILADFPVPSLPRVHCSVSMQFHGFFQLGIFIESLLTWRNLCGNSDSIRFRQPMQPLLEFLNILGGLGTEKE